MAIDAAVYPFALAEQRLASASASGPALAAFPGAQILSLDTLLLDATEAQNQATRRQALAEAYCEPWSGTLTGIDLGLTEGLIYTLPTEFIGAAAVGLLIEIVEQPDLSAGGGTTAVTFLVKRL